MAVALLPCSTKPVISEGSGVRLLLAAYLGSTFYFIFIAVPLPFLLHSRGQPLERDSHLTAFGTGNAYVCSSHLADFNPATFQSKPPSFVHDGPTSFFYSAWHVCILLCSVPRNLMENEMKLYDTFEW